MRTTRAAIVLGLAVTLSSGCLFLPKKPDNKDVKPTPVLAGKASSESLVNYLNENARLVTSVRAQIAMAVMQKGKGAEPTGEMACRKPNDFRLRAKVLGFDEVDLVSNSDELSFWIKRAAADRQFVCKHKDMATGKVPMNIPFQPDMVLAALGMKDYDPAAKYELKTFDTTHELVFDAVAADGKPVRRTVVFRRKPTSGDESQVYGHVIKDAKGKLICTAVVEKVHRDRSGAVVPSVVKIDYPAEEMTMKLTLSDIRVNAITTEDAGRLFTRTPIPGAKVVDLAENAGGVSRAGYYPR